MNTLRTKVISLIVVANLAVIGTAVSLSLLLVSGPSLERFADFNANYISLILDSEINRGSQQVIQQNEIHYFNGFDIRDKPASGKNLDDRARYLGSALKKRSILSSITVTKTAERFWLEDFLPVASISLPDKKWLVIPIVMPPPRAEILPLLLGVILIIVVGTAIVAVIAVRRMMRPLALIENCVGSVNFQGELPRVPETGPADIQTTARAINLLSSRLKRSLESRMRLIAAAGHDLRTPMTRMRLRAEFLDDPHREKWLTDLDELDHIADSAIQVVHAGIDSNIGQEMVSLDTLVADVVAEVRELKLEASVVRSESVQVLSKRLSLKRAIRNLVVNAATHGGGATVSMRHRDGSVVIDILDDGPGIPEEVLPFTFEPFFRVDPARSSTAGAGLGLAIANEIIQRNRGSLILVNRPTGGLAQTIEIPLG
jgi:signal transduction histidine kinase